MNELDTTRRDGPLDPRPGPRLLLGFLAFLVALAAGADPNVALAAFLAFQPGGSNGPRPTG